MFIKVSTRTKMPYLELIEPQTKLKKYTVNINTIQILKKTHPFKNRT